MKPIVFESVVVVSYKNLGSIVAVNITRFFIFCFAWTVKDRTIQEVGEKFKNYVEYFLTLTSIKYTTK